MVKKVSYMSRALQLLKDRNYIYQKVETYNIYDRKRHDLFGFIDVLYLRDKIVGLQVCGADFASHKTKFEECKDIIKAWLDADGELILMGWRKLKVKRGGKASKWTPRIEKVTIKKNKLTYEEITEEEL